MLSLKDQVDLLRADIKIEIDFIKHNLEYDTKAHEKHKEQDEIVMSEIYRQSMNANKKQLKTLERLLNKINVIDGMVPEED